MAMQNQSSRRSFLRGLGTLLAKGMQGAFGFTGVKWQAALIVLAMSATIGVLASLAAVLFAPAPKATETPVAPK